MTAARLFRCSPSSLTAYGNCPRAYWFGYVAKPRPVKPPLNAYRAVGVSVHNGLAQVWDKPDAQPADLVAGAWIREPFTDPKRSARWLARAQRWVTRYVAEHVDRAVQPVGVERTVSTKTAGLAFSGRVDRVDDRDGALVVVDYKVGHKPPEPGEARSSQQLALYGIAAGRTFKRGCWRVELHHIPTGTVEAAVHDRESLTRQLARAEDTAADALTATDTLEAGAHRDQVFPPAPGPLCGHCDWRDHCPEGQTVPAADPEALLDRWETAA